MSTKYRTSGDFRHRSRYQYILVKTECHGLVMTIDSTTPYDLSRCSECYMHGRISVHIYRITHGAVLCDTFLVLIRSSYRGSNLSCADRHSAERNVKLLSKIHHGIAQVK
jgi:hypothetical protein